MKILNKNDAAKFLRFKNNGDRYVDDKLARLRKLGMPFIRTKPFTYDQDDLEQWVNDLKENTPTGDTP